jgi:hypothetical protein
LAALVLSSPNVHILYLDESGSVEAPDHEPSGSPVMAILGVIIDASSIPQLTRDFLALKRRYFPDLFMAGRALSHVLREVKGSNVLKLTRSDSRNKRRHAWLVRTEVLRLLSHYDCRVLGRVWVKQSGSVLKPAETYGYAVQDIATHFCRFLDQHDSQGFFIADSRSPGPNVQVAHSVFTQKWRTAGDPYPRLLEVPVFAHSDNHAGLQLSDLVVSTLVFPMACSAYGTPPGNIHGCARYHRLRTDHGQALRSLQFQYADGSGRLRGGVIVSDPVGRRPSSRLFEPALCVSRAGLMALAGRDRGGYGKRCSRIWATPSDSQEGITWVAAARTSGWALATA